MCKYSDDDITGIWFFCKLWTFYAFKSGVDFSNFIQFKIIKKAKSLCSNDLKQSLNGVRILRMN